MAMDRNKASYVPLALLALVIAFMGGIAAVETRNPDTYVHCPFLFFSFSARRSEANHLPGQHSHFARLLRETVATAFIVFATAVLGAPLAVGQRAIFGLAGILGNLELEDNG